MDRYHIYEAIGKGKHSVVYKGRRKKTIQYYAIKSIDKSQRSRVLREVQVLRATNSAYVLKFHAWYETANHLWLVLEYCVGGDLLGLLKQDVRLPEASIKTFGKDLVTALRVAHEAGVLHCDLKPSNLLIDEDGRIKLCGFGLAKKVSEVVFFGGAGDDGTAATKSNGDGPGSAPAKKKSKLVGTPCYMAPELFGEHGVHSYASDLWAIGCVLYECAFGVPPFVSSSLSDLMEMILNDDPGGFDGMGAVDGKNLDGNERVGGTDAEPNVTKNFADLVQGLLNKDPSRRMNWETLLMHPFWVDGEKENANAKETENARWKSPPRKPLPAQNAFDAAVAASVRAELGDDAERFGVTQKRTVGNVSVDREHCENPIAPRSPTREKSETEAAARREPRAKTFPKLVRASGSKSAEVVRLSLAARANLEREEGGASYADTGGRGCFVENGRDRAVSEILSPEKVTGAGDSVENNPSPWWKAKSSCTAAGDVSLADADAELNFSEGVFCVAEEETDGGGVTGGKDEHEGARFLSGGGAEDGDSPVSRSKNVFEKSALFSEQKLGERELTDIVSDPGPDVAAAAAEGERQAAAAEEREAAAASREVDDRQTDGGATTDGAPFSAARGADAASPSPNSKQRSPPARPEKDAVEHELDHRISVLLDHPSDSQVKPIVLNRRIEITPPPVWDENALPFAALTATQMLAATQTDLELFLTKVYRSVAHSSPINEKVNTLSYFETLCCDTASANVLINSSLMTLFVRMLRASKAPALRVRLTSVMGLLLRHATYITPELASSGIVSVLTECLRDKNDKVRRRAAATLGELLFYIATQQHEAACAAANRGAKKKTSAPAKNTKDDDDATRAAVAAAAAADAWRIPASTVGTLLRTLRAGEDEIAQHYAVKTVENIVSHGGEWSAKFCGDDTTHAVVGIVTSAQSEQLRGTAASTLSRASRVSPETTKLLMEKFGTGLIVTGLKDPSPKVQQAMLNVLARGAGFLGSRALKNALDDEPVAGGGGGGVGVGRATNRSTPSKTATTTHSPLPALAQLLERGSAVLRAKALLALAALVRRDKRWLLRVCAEPESGSGSGSAGSLPTVIDRLVKDKDSYLQSALKVLQDVIHECVPAIHKETLQEVRRRRALRNANAAAGASRETGTGVGDAADGALHLFPATSRVMACVSLGGDVLTDECTVTDVADLLEIALEASHDPFPFAGFAKFRRDALALLETLSRRASCVAGASNAATNHLLPVLAKMLVKHDGNALALDSDAADGRFLALKLTCDVLLPMLLQRDLPHDTKGALLQLLRQTLLPATPALLGDEDPIPLYALKLLGGALECDSESCAVVCQLGLAPKFFTFLSLEHTNNNVHNVRLCLALTTSRAVSFQSLCEFGCGEKVSAVLTYTHENQVEPFLEPALGIARALLQRAAEVLERDNGAGGALAQSAFVVIAPLLTCVSTFLLCAALGRHECVGPNVPVLAAEALRLLCSLLPHETSATLFSEEEESSREDGGEGTSDKGTSALARAVAAIGTEAALSRNEPGFGDCGAVEATGGFGLGGGGVQNETTLAFAWSSGGGAGSGNGAVSPRRGFASAQRTALEVIAACARSANCARRETKRFADLEQTLRRLAQREPNVSIAHAAVAAADGIKRTAPGYRISGY